MVDLSEESNRVVSPFPFGTCWRRGELTKTARQPAEGERDPRGVGCEDRSHSVMPVASAEGGEEWQEEKRNGQPEDHAIFALAIRSMWGPTIIEHRKTCAGFDQDPRAIHARKEEGECDCKEETGEGTVKQRPRRPANGVTMCVTGRGE